MKQLALKVCSLLLAGACIHPGTPKSVPTAFNTPSDRAEILSLAKKSLTADGFEITSTDLRLGVVTAKRVRTGTANAKFVKCAFPGDTVTYANIQTTIEITVRTRPDGAQITNAVRVMVPRPGGTPQPLPPTQNSCVSTDKAEGNVRKTIETAYPRNTSSP
jgi:hypothetical protein